MLNSLIILSEKFIQYPLFSKDTTPLIKLETKQLQSIESYNQKLTSGEYKYQHVKCLCSNATEDTDVTIAHKDRYGISVDFILCLNCGLIRINTILREIDLHHFYEFYYRPIYNPVKSTPSHYFKNELTQGRKFLSLFNRYASDYKLNRIFEIGCGSGGILYPFRDIGNELIGCDFDVDFLKYGIDKGLNLVKGTMEDAAIPDESIDLFILSHVLEHIIDPIDELLKINEKIKIGGYLLIEVPGTASLHKGIFPRFFQNVHLYIFHQEFLENIMQQLGYKTLYANEDVTLLFQKTQNVTNLSSIEIKAYPEKASEIHSYIKFSYLYYYSPLNIHKLKRNTRKIILQILDDLNLREPLRKLLKGY